MLAAINERNGMKREKIKTETNEKKKNYKNGNWFVCFVYEIDEIKIIIFFLSY